MTSIERDTAVIHLLLREYPSEHGMARAEHLAKELDAIETTKRGMAVCAQERVDSLREHNRRLIEISVKERDIQSACRHLSTHRESNPTGEAGVPSWCDHCGKRLP